MLHESLSIAIDFDGTIVEDEYPKIGKPRVYAFETLKALEQKGHRLIPARRAAYNARPCLKCSKVRWMKPAMKA